MGNIHGNCINCDALTRDGSTYFAKPRPDFLTANDAWFMPVVAEDRAGRLPVHPRLVRPLPLLPGRQPRSRGHRPPAAAGCTAFATRTRRGPEVRSGEGERRPTDRAAAQPQRLFRDLAQRLLTRAQHDAGDAARSWRSWCWTTRRRARPRMHALWALVGIGPLDPDFHERTARAQGRRLPRLGRARGGQHRQGGRGDSAEGRSRWRAIRRRTCSFRWPSPPARSRASTPMPSLLDVLAACGDDKLIPPSSGKTCIRCWRNRRRAFLSWPKAARLQEGAEPRPAAAARHRAHPGTTQTEPWLVGNLLRVLAGQGRRSERRLPVSGRAGRQAAEPAKWPASEADELRRTFRA